MRALRTLAILTLILAASACQTSTKAAAPLSSPSSASPSSVASPTPGGIRTVDWGGVTLPASACGMPGPVQPHKGRAAITSSLFPGDPTATPDNTKASVISDDPDEVVYGTLSGAAGPVAVLGGECDNGGGTADGVLLNFGVVYAYQAGTLTALGTLHAKYQPTDVLPTLLQFSFVGGAIKAAESWYGDSDPTCCPSGKATTTWTYSGGQLIASAPAITATPTTSPPS